MRRTFGLFACLFLVLTLVSSHRMADDGDRIYAEIQLLQVVATEQRGCSAAYKFADLFYGMNEAGWQAIDDDLIAKMSALLDQYSALRDDGCMSFVIADIFGRLGARAKAAVPALERALKAAELARVEAFERSRSSWRDPTDCLMLGVNFDRKADYVIRQALWSIDGREREVGYTLNCPMDGVPPS
jgi:hypothetical protein